MGVTREQGVQLAALAIACRPHGAPRWDEQGTVAALGRVSHLALPDVIRAIVSAAEDRTAKTPAVITNLQSPHWRPADPDRQRPHMPYDPAEHCGTCGRPLAGHQGDHEPVRADRTAAEAVDSREGHAARLKRLRDEAAAQLCRHMVPLTNCNDCRKAAEVPTTADAEPSTTEGD